jgi:Flp pilus assembly protein TadG
MSNELSTVPATSKRSRLFKRFLQNTSGNVTIMLGLTLIPVTLGVGAAVDFGRVSREQAVFYNAVDAATLAVAADDRSAVQNLEGAALQTRLADLQQYATKYIQANYKDQSGGEADIAVTVSITGSAVQLNATLEFPTTFMQMAGIDTLTMKANSRVQKAMKPIELVMVMDTTGSMRNDMAGAQTAANKLLSTLYSDPSPTSKVMKSEFIRTALVPFSAAVRLDTAAYDFDLAWIDTTGVNPLSKINFSDVTWNNYHAWSQIKKTSTTFHGWNGCVESRKTGTGTANYITSDVAPNNVDPETRFPAYFNPDSPTWYTGSNRNNYPSGSGSTSGVWNNNYIDSFTNYTTGANTTSLLNPSGANRTGYDDSVIGNNNVLATRWKNVAKYQNKVIGNETWTLGGDGVTWSVTAGPWVNCTASKVVPMTYDRARIEAGINSMRAYGGTNIAEGLAWGMRAISPGAPFTKVEGASGIPANTISPYNDVRWQKIMVLMTDGENDPYSRYSNGTLVNFNDTGTSYNSLGAVTTTTTGNLNRYGSTTHSAAGPKLDTYTTSMCNSLKASGVTIYAVGFRVDSALMKSCATSPAHYSYASSLPQLVAFFDHIGQDVLNKMIYVSK